MLKKTVFIFSAMLLCSVPAVSALSAQEAAQRADDASAALENSLEMELVNAIIRRDLVEILRCIKAGANVNYLVVVSASDKDGQVVEMTITPIQLAVVTFDIEMIRMLLNAGASLDVSFIYNDEKITLPEFVKRIIQDVSSEYQKHINNEQIRRQLEPLLENMRETLNLLQEHKKETNL